MCFVNIRFVCFHSGAAILRPIGEQYRVLCASVNSHIFFFFNQILYFDFSAYSAAAAAICVHCVEFCSVSYIHHLHIYIYVYNTAYIDYFSSPIPFPSRQNTRILPAFARFPYTPSPYVVLQRHACRLIFARVSIQRCIPVPYKS